MRSTTLQEILDAEQEIEEKLGAERQEAKRWLERTKAELEHERQRAFARITDAAEQAKVVAARDAEARAAAIVQDAVELAAGLERMSDAELKRVVWRHMACITPGGQA